MSAAEKLVLGHYMSMLHRYGSDDPSDREIREQIAEWREAGLDGVLIFDILVRQDAVKSFYRVGAKEGFKFGPTLGAMDRNTVANGWHAELLSEIHKRWPRAELHWVDGTYLLSDYSSNPRLFTVADALSEIVGPLHIQPHVVPRNISNSQPWRSGELTSARPESLARMIAHPDWSRADGFASFDIANTPEGQGDLVRWYAEAAHAAGKTARGAIVAHYKGYAHKGNWMVFESWGYQRLLESWRGAIDSDIDAVEFITLNDMSESSYIITFGKGGPIEVDHWNTSDNAAILDHSGFRDFSKRYVEWFKTGIEPAITEDELYYAYRLHPRDAADYADLSESQRDSLATWIPSGQDAERIYTRNGIVWDRFSDGIHAAVRLTAPAEVYINGVNMGTFAAGEHLISRPGAISNGRSVFGYPLYTFAPSDFGFPTFEIRRDGQTVIKHTGELEITAYSVPGCWNMFARKAPAPAK